MATKISFVSLGCDKNLIDSEIMLGLIDEKGYIITPNDSEADVIIINSCGFIFFSISTIYVFLFNSSFIFN